MKLSTSATCLVGLREIASKERSEIDRGRRLLLHYETRMMETLVEHEAIITAIAEKDPDRAAKTMEAHILQMGKLLMHLREKRPELFGS
jgi:DNA-binding GntR family transcriptional regulator